MYALTATGYRSITSADDLLPGETLSETIPAPLQAALAADKATRANIRAAIASEADAALAELRAFRDLSAPTNAQTLAVVKLLCRVCIGLIKLSLNKLSEAN